jgi:hypothetical protein
MDSLFGCFEHWKTEEVKWPVLEARSSNPGSFLLSVLEPSLIEHIPLKFWLFYWTHHVERSSYYMENRRDVTDYSLPSVPLI